MFEDKVGATWQIIQRPDLVGIATKMPVFTEPVKVAQRSERSHEDVDDQTLNQVRQTLQKMVPGPTGVTKSAPIVPDNEPILEEKSKELVISVLNDSEDS